MAGPMTITLTRGMVTQVDAEDGARVAAAGPWRAKESDGGRLYAYSTRHGYLHRFLTGRDGTYVDHANGDSLDNRRANLRVATPSQNNANRPCRRDSASGIKGVRQHGARWLARCAGKHLGVFDTATEAAAAYDAAARDRWGDYARLSGGAT